MLALAIYKLLQCCLEPVAVPVAFVDARVLLTEVSAEGVYLQPVRHFLVG